MANQKKSNSETVLMDSLKSLLGVARKILRKENQDQSRESDVNQNVEGITRVLYLIKSRRGTAGSTSKSKVLNSKYS